MLKGLRTAVKYFVIGLIAGLIFAPRKGSEMRDLLVRRGKEYAEETLGITEHDSKDDEE